MVVAADDCQLFLGGAPVFVDLRQAGVEVAVGGVCADGAAIPRRALLLLCSSHSSAAPLGRSRAARPVRVPVRGAFGGGASA